MYIAIGQRSRPCAPYLLIALASILLPNAVIAQNAEPTVSLEVDSGSGMPNQFFYTLSEDNVDANVRISLSAPSADTVEVTLATGPDPAEIGSTYGLCSALEIFSDRETCAATPGRDFGAINERISFEPGETSKLVPLTIINDRVTESDQAFAVSLSAPRNAVLPDPADSLFSVRSINISDDDVSTDAFLKVFITNGFIDISEQIQANVDEGTGVVTATVTLSEAATVPVEVSIFTEPRGATAGEDFEAIDRRLRFAPGETSKDVLISIIDDSIVEENTTPGLNEDILVGLRGAWAARIRPTRPGVGTFPVIRIIDNDATGATPTITLQNTRASEGDGVATVAFGLSAATDQPVTALVFTRAESANPGEDYWGTTQTITFEPGDTSTSIDVVLLDDAEPENEEFLKIFVINAVNANLPTPNSATLTIIDDDTDQRLPVVDIDGTTVSESDGTAVVTLRLDRPDPNNAVRLRVFNQGGQGTATPGQDFWGFARDVEIAPGELTASVAIVILDDDDMEPVEQIKVRVKIIENATLARQPLFGEVDITDNDTR